MMLSCKSDGRERVEKLKYHMPDFELIEILGSVSNDLEGIEGVQGL